MSSKDTRFIKNYVVLEALPMFFGLGFSRTCYIGVLLYETELGCNLYQFVGQNLDLKSNIYVGL